MVSSGRVKATDICQSNYFLHDPDQMYSLIYPPGTWTDPMQFVLGDLDTWLITMVGSSPKPGGWLTEYFQVHGLVVHPPSHGSPWQLFLFGKAIFKLLSSCQVAPPPGREAWWFPGAFLWRPFVDFEKGLDHTEENAMQENLASLFFKKERSQPTAPDKLPLEELVSCE